MEKINKVMIIIIGLFLLISYFKVNNRYLTIDNNLNKNYIAINDNENNDNLDGDIVDCDALSSGIKITSKVDKEDINDWSFKLHVKIIYSYGNNVSEDITLDKDNSTISYLVGHQNVFFEITEEANDNYEIEFTGLNKGVQEGNKYYGVFNTDTDSLLNITITNKYKYNDLIIKKKVIGNHKVNDGEFKFRILFNNDDKLENSYKYVLNNQDEGTLELNDEEIGKEGSFTLKENDTMVIKDLPIGTSYQILEDNIDGYELITKKVTGVIKNDNNEVEFTSKIRGTLINLGIEFWIVILLVIIIIIVIIWGIKICFSSKNKMQKKNIKSKKQIKKNNVNVKKKRK